MGAGKVLLRVMFWVLTVAFLVVGNHLALLDNNMDLQADQFNVETAQVAHIVNIEEFSHQVTPDFAIESTIITFNARLSSGEREGEYVLAEHNLDGLLIVRERPVEVGDRVLLTYEYAIGRYAFVDYVRINYIAILGGVLLGLMVLFGGLRGFGSVVALGFTCAAVFLVLVPSILGGRNIYLVAVLVCVYIIVSTLIIVVGPNKKAACAIIGCLGGVAVAAGLMFFMDVLLNLTGVIDNDSQFILALPVDYQLDLRAIVFAGVIVGAVGAIMDVAMSIASSLWEVSRAGEELSFGRIFSSGLNIGKDILGTMLNTLILAYIGSSLSLILMIAFHSHATSFIELFNREPIAVEVLRALIGSFGIFLAIPITAATCGWLYSRKEGRIRPEKPPRNRREGYSSDW